MSLSEKKKYYHKYDPEYDYQIIYEDYKNWFIYKGLFQLYQVFFTDNSYENLYRLIIHTENNNDLNDNDFSRILVKNKN